MLFLLRITLLFYFLAVITSLGNLYFRRQSLRNATPFLVLMGFLVHLTAMVGVGLSHGELPIRSLDQTLSFLCGSAILVYLIGYYRHRLEILNLVVPSLVLILMIIAILLPEGTLAVSEGLQNPLQQFHIVVAILGVSLLFLTFSTSLLYLILDQGLKAKRPLQFIYRLPSLEKCDRLNFQSLTFGFVLLTVGLLTGAVSNAGFAESGFPWKREGLAILSWAIFGVILIARLARGWRGRKAAILTLIAFTGILVRMLRIF